MDTHQHTPIESHLAPVKIAAMHFAVSPDALYKRIRLGDIPNYKFGRKVLVDLNEVRAALRVPVRANGGLNAV